MATASQITPSTQQTREEKSRSLFRFTKVRSLSHMIPCVCVYIHTHTKRKLENYVLDRGASRLAMARSKAGWQLFYIRFFFLNLLLVVVIKCLITASTDHSSLPRNGRPSTRLNRQPEPVAARRGVKCFRVPAFAKACVPWRQPRIRLWLPRITQQCSCSLDRGKWRFSPFFCLHPEHYLQFTGSKL